MLLATAGHVDHGKTSLIKALTGQETDRLAEEKRRGLTIELGFAYFTTDAGVRIGIVDVPGHSKFIRTMAAGVAGVDVALVVVAASEGVMPQTREHVALLGIFGITRCILVLSKADLVEKDDKRWSTLQEECAELLEASGIGIEHSVAVSTETGQGIDELKNLLCERANTTQAADRKGHFRLAVDRVFSVRGAGTIVTGTGYSGEIKVEDAVVLQPSGLECRVKTIHADGESAESAGQGQRLALNIAGVSVDDINRGDWVCSNALQQVSDCTDVHMNLLPGTGMSLRHWQKVHVHAGSSRVVARVSLYSQRVLKPGESTFAQLVFEKPVHMVFGDRLVLRHQDASQTLGGAVAITAIANRKKLQRSNRPEVLAILDQIDHRAVLRGLLEEAEQPVNISQFCSSRNLLRKEFDQLFDADSVVRMPAAAIRLVGDGRLNITDNSDWLILKARYEASRSQLCETVAAFHLSTPESRGLDKTELLQQAGNSGQMGESAVVQQCVLQLLLQESELQQFGNQISKPDFTPVLPAADQKFLESVLQHVTENTLKPPSLSALAEELSVESGELKQRLEPLEQAGAVLRIAENRLYHPRAFERLVEVAQQLSEANGTAGFEAKAFRDQTGIGRNITIDVLEHMDRIGLTRRLGNQRVWRGYR